MSPVTAPRTNRCSAVAATVVLAFVHVLSAQRSPSPVTGANTPEFEVASVKANNSPTAPAMLSGATPGRFVASNTPLRFIILYAYQLLDHQLIGAPDWTSTTGFDITGTYPPGRAATDHDVRLMVQKLLSDRFGLSVHREQREVPTYLLVLARSDGRLGPQLRRSDVDCEKWIAEKRPKTDAGGPSPVTPSGKRAACMMMATRRFLSGGTRTMDQLATTLQSMVGRPVVNRTGLTGAFDMDLQWTPVNDPRAASGSDAGANDSPSIFAAVQEQLGLKLEARRDRFEVVIIDRVTRPTAN